MIEFKADCGHTVRAKDQDSGKTVRCSYCGTEVCVPASQEDSLDFLFEEVGSSAARPAITEQPKRRKRKKPTAVTVSKKPGDFDPFALAIKMGYVAVAIIAIVIVARFAYPTVKGYWDKAMQASAPAVAPQPVVTKPDKPRPKPKMKEAPPARRMFGLMTLANGSGLYVTSTPPGASVFIVDAARAPKRSRMSEVSGAVALSSEAKSCGHAPGKYVVEVAVPWSDKNLNRFPGFREFRRQIETTSTASSRRLVEDYFLPDEADDVFVDKRDDQIFIVRQYRDVEVGDKGWTSVRAMFLPKVMSSDQSSFDLATAAEFLPDKDTYKYDVELVDQELEYYGIAIGDRDIVKRFLSRIGIAPYIEADSKTLLFKIDVESGALGNKTLK